MKTNIHLQIFKLDIFKEQLKIIENEKIKFIHPKNFEKSIIKKKRSKKNFISQ